MSRIVCFFFVLSAVIGLTLNADFGRERRYQETGGKRENDFVNTKAEERAQANDPGQVTTKPANQPTKKCSDDFGNEERDKAADQLSEYSKAHQNEKEVLTTSAGKPIGDKTNVLTVGPRGPMLIQDFVFMDEMAHFDRERIPERVVHAKGAGAFGYFQVTHDITQYTKASVFSKIGKKTPIAVRFSVVAGESGSADTVRDPRGFAVKFYTETGNWDLTGNDTPIFFIRDPFFFPSFIHTQKRNPATHLKDHDMFWDFLTLRPESTHQVFFLFSDRGIPDGFRHMHGFGSHTFKLVNAEGEAVYCKFHYKTDQGIKNLPPDEAAILAGQDPDYATRDLYNNIAMGNFPSWTMYIQVMTFAQAEKQIINPFDVTKTWPYADFPLIEVGKLVLNRNPSNYFAQVEQLAFSPANFIPGIEASPDKMLQGRLFAYTDTQRYRLGANFNKIPVNSPYNAVHNYQRDGADGIDGGAPNYYPNSFGGPRDSAIYEESRFHVNADVARFNSSDDDNYSQVTIFWKKVLKPDERERLIDNIAGHLSLAQDFIQERAIKIYSNVDAEVGHMLSISLALLKKASV